MSRLNKTAKLAFFTARRRKGDVAKIAENTYYSVSHISNVVAGRRTVPENVGKELYNISRRRMKNSELLLA